MTNKNLNKFGKKFINLVRDEVFDKWSAILNDKTKAPRLRDIGQLIHKFDGKPEELAQLLIPEIVDSCLSQILHMIESTDELSIQFSDIDIREVSDGLVGELYGEEGWIAKFSKYSSTETKKTSGKLDL